MSWDNVGKKEGKGGSGRFVQFENDVTEQMRVLDEMPFVNRVHKISQSVKKGDKTEEIFRTIPATTNPDDNYILKNNPSRYPDVQQFNLRVWSYKRGADGKVVEDGEFKILQGGNAIFKSLKKLYEENGHLNQYDIQITRTGKGRDTEYTVSAAPFHKNVNVADLTAKLATDETLKWENVFPSVTGEEQQKMLRDAGLDVNYDPARDIAASLDIQKALAEKFTFGKHKDKTVGELMVIDAGYVKWASENVTSSDTLAAACRVAIGNQEQLNRGEEPVRQIEAPKATVTTKAETVPPSTPPQTKSADREQLMRKISEIFEKNSRFEDVTEIVASVKKHGDGKTKVKELTIKQLEDLYADISAG